MAKFADALDRSAETIKRPPPLPLGHYIMRVTKMPDPPEEMDTKVGKMEKLTISVASVSPLDDVDPDELEAFGNPSGVPLRIDFLFSSEDENKFEATLDRLKRFCGYCGIDVTAGSLSSWLTELPNAQFVGEVKHRLDPNDSEITYSEVGRTAPVE